MLSAGYQAALHVTTRWLVAVAFSCVVAETRPVIFWMSEPIQPGETVLLFGDQLGPNSTVEGWRLAESGPSPAAQQLTVLQASKVSVKVVIPAEWKPGMFALRVKSADGISDTVYLNRSEPWWFSAGEGHTAFAGEQIRVFGKNLGPSPAAWLGNGSGRVPLKVEKADAYAVRLTIPASTPAGQFQLWILNGWGGELGRSDPLTIQVAHRVPWPSTRFDIRDFGATGDGVHDDTEAIRAALARARSQGGGVVWLPGGRYRVSGKLVIPPRTTVRGEKRESVWLFVPKTTPEFDAVFAGNHDFAIEELSLVGQTPLRLIAAPDVPSAYKGPLGAIPPAGERASNVRLHRLRLQHLLFAHRVLPNDPRRNIATGYDTIYLSGDDLELSDSEVISSGMPIAVFSGSRLRIEGNRLDTGRNGWYGLFDTQETDFENNVVEGRDLEASYGGFQSRSYRVYYAGNRLQDAYGGEREALTFDTPYTPLWMGRVAHATPTNFETVDYSGAEKRWTPGQLKGLICLIVYGKGLGEYIPISDNTETTVALARPWPVIPDQASHVVVNINRSEIVITQNHFSDASAAPQLYSLTYGVIIDGNEAERTGGSYAMTWDLFQNSPQRTRRYSYSMFNQWLNNTFHEGFIYDYGPWVNGVVGPLTCDGLQPPAMVALGNVVRGNHVSDHYTIGAFRPGPHPATVTSEYVAQDTVIEGNSVDDSPVGIDIYPGFRDSLVRHNLVRRCPVPFSDDGVHTRIDPAERLDMQYSAAQERFGRAVQPRPQTLAGLWAAVAKAAKDPVALEVPAMLIGLHYELAGDSVRLRTEPWAPAVSVTSEGRTAQLNPGVIAGLPAAEEVSITLDGVTLRVSIPKPAGTPRAVK